METKTKDEASIAPQVTAENQINDNEITIDEGKLERYLNTLKLEQNLLLGTISGVFAAILGASIWAIVTIATNFQIGWMAVAVGFLVGYAIRITGKGMDKIFGYIGAVLALVGCLMGNFFTVVGLLASEEGLSFFETLVSIDYSYLPSILIQTGSPMDILFYGIAIYEGYKFSFRKITEEQIVKHAS